MTYFGGRAFRERFKLRIKWRIKEKRYVSPQIFRDRFNRNIENNYRPWRWGQVLLVLRFYSIPSDHYKKGVRRVPTVTRLSPGYITRRASQTRTGELIGLAAAPDNAAAQVRK